MGSMLCYTYGSKTYKQIDEILQREYDSKRTTNDKQIKEIIEYIEQYLNRFHKIGFYVREKIEHSGKRLSKRSNPEDLNLILNGFQLYELILKSVQRFVKTRQELSDVHQKASAVKMKLQKSINPARRYRSKKVDSYFLINYLKFQDTVFKAILRMLGNDFNFNEEDERKNKVEMFRLILLNWKEIFAIWRTYELHNFDHRIKKIFELTSLRTQLYYKNDRILKVLEDIYHICPIKMIRQSNTELLAITEQILESENEDIKIKGVKILYGLLLNIVKHKDLALVNEVLGKYNNKQVEVLYFLIVISRDSAEIEEILLDILIERVKDDDEYIDLLYKLLDNSSISLLNYSNLVLLTDLMIKIYKNRKISDQNKFLNFCIFAKNAGLNAQIGLFGFLKNLFLQLLVHTDCIDLFYNHLVDFLLTKPQIQESEFFDKNIVKLVFELSDLKPEFINIIILLDSLTTAQGNTAEMGIVLFFIIENVEKNLSEGIPFFLSNKNWFEKLMMNIKLLIHLNQNFTDDKKEIGIYVNSIINLLEKTDNILILLCVFFGLYEFSKNHPVNEKVITIMEKYDELLGKSIYKKCFLNLKLFKEENEINFEELRKEIQNDNDKLNQSDIDRLKDILSENYGIIKQYNNSVQYDSVIDDEVHIQSNISNSNYEVSESRTIKSSKYTYLVQHDVESLYQINLRKNIEKFQDSKILKM